MPSSRRFRSAAALRVLAACLALACSACATLSPAQRDRATAIASSFAAAECRVKTAFDGKSGLSGFLKARPDLVVTDIDMPRLGGIELITLIKRDVKLKSLPVMIVSYKDREEDRMRGLDAGANCYLTKSSFHDRTFLDTVVDLIGEALE